MRAESSWWRHGHHGARVLEQLARLPCFIHTRGEGFGRWSRRLWPARTSRWWSYIGARAQNGGGPLQPRPGAGDPPSARAHAVDLLLVSAQGQQRAHLRGTLSTARLAVYTRTTGSRTRATLTGMSSSLLLVERVSLRQACHSGACRGPRARRASGHAAASKRVTGLPAAWHAEVIC